MPRENSDAMQCFVRERQVSEVDVVRRRVLIMSGAAVVSTLACAGTVVLGTRVPAVPFVTSSCGAVGSKRVLVAYGSQYGSTGEISQAIADRLCARGMSADVRRAQEAANPADYDAVVVGSAIQGGRWLASALSFVEEHAAVLSRMPLAVFCAHMAYLDDSEESASKRAAYLDGVYAHVSPSQEGFFAGKLGPLRLPGRLALQWVGLPEGDLRDWDAIAGWADAVFPDLA